jgi:hypothetical protein
MPWAKQLVVDARRKPWGARIDGVDDWNRAQNSAMYLELLSRVRGSQGDDKALRLFPHAELEAELLGLRKKDEPGGGLTVYDAGGGKDGRNRKVGGVHRDIAMSLAACCLLAAMLRLEMPRSLSDVDEIQKQIDRDLGPSPVADLLREGRGGRFRF